LASAGGIAAYTQLSGSDTGEPVYTVPLRPADRLPRAPAAATARTIDPDDRDGLTRALQRELRRVGCYNGEITGVWTTSSRMAMKSFIERVNASLPIDNPDPVLLSLVQGHQERACGVACPAGQTTGAGGGCMPTAVRAAVGDGEERARSDGAGAAAAGAAAGAAALATGAKAPATEPKGISSDAARSARAPVGDSPVPPEGMREGKPRKSAGASSPRPPKVVRDVLKVFGLKF
jgi:peptidoglycan hydrolase-like protein with peptidoglycan-binding domain